MKNTFYGVGVGPGEPELLTLKAVSVIKKSDYIILPAKDKESCHAYQIAVRAVPEIENKRIIFEPFPMTMNKEALNLFHYQIAQKVEKLLDDGNEVSFLTIGDPTIYSTFTYVQDILNSHGYRAELINGITSFTAAAARLGISLGLGNEPIHIIPGSYPIEDTMDFKGTRVYMKSGKKMAELIEFLKKEACKKNIDVRFVSNCGMENEIIGNSLDELKCEQGYLTVVIVKDK